MSVTETEGLRDTAPTRANQAQAARTVSRSDAAADAAAGVLFNVLDQAARTDGDENVRRAALQHISNMRERGLVVFPEDMPGEDAATVAAAARAQTAVPAVETSRPPVAAEDAAREAVMDLMASTGLVSRTPAATPAAEDEPAAPAASDAPVIRLEFAAPADLADELDLDDEDEPPPAAIADLEEGIDEFTDPQIVEAIRRAQAAEKKAAHYERLRLADGKKAWVAEAQQHLGAAVTKEQLEGIDATSRRDFWRQAKAVHQSNVELLKPLAAQLLGNAAADAERIREEAREEAKRAWGRPTVNTPGVGLPANATFAEDVERHRRRGNFQDYMKAKLKMGGF